MSGGFGLTAAGSGTVVLAGNNTYTGGTTISAGAISLNNANAVANSTVTVNTNNGLLFNSNSGAIATFNVGGLAGSGNISLADGGYPVTLSTGGNGTGTTYRGALSGSGGLAQAGSGILVLAGSNSYSGVTTISAGTLAYSGSGNKLAGAVNVGTSPGSSGTLLFQGPSVVSFTATGDGNFNVAYGSTVAIQPGASVTLAGNLKLGAQDSGSSGNLVQSGGTLIISDSTGRPLTIGEWPGETSTYTLSAGLLSVPNSLTYVPWDGAAVLNISGGTANLKQIEIGSGDGAASGGTIALSGSGALYLGSGGIADGYGPAAINLTGGTLGASAAWSSSVPMSLANTPTINTNGGEITLSGLLSGTGGLSKIGASHTLLLTASNTYTGVTTISAGTLQLGNGSSGNDGAVTGNIANSAVLYYDLYGAQTYSGSISGNGSLSKNGNGALYLTGSNSFTGAVTVNQGWVTITNSLALGSGTKTITITNGASGNDQLHLNAGGGPAIVLPATIGFTLSNASSGAMTDPTQGTIVNDGGNNVIAGNITNTTGGGGVILASNSGSITFSGNYTPTTTGRSLVMRGNAAGTFSGIIANGSTVNLPVFKDSGSGDWTLSGLNTYGGTTTIQAGTLSVGLLANGGVLSNIGTSANSAANLVLGGGGLQYTGSGASTNRLFTITPAGGTLDASGAGNAALLFTNTGTIVSSDATAQTVTEFAGTNPTFVQLSGAEGVSSDLAAGMSVSGSGIPANTVITAVGPNSITLNNAATSSGTATLTFGATNRTLTLTGSSAGANQLAGALTDSPGGGQLAVVKTGPGFWSLSGSNTYSGPTTVSAGTLQLGSSAALPGGTAATVNGTLDLGTYGAVVSALTGTGTVNHSETGSNTLTVGSDNASGSFAGTIENSGGTLALLKIGSGQLILSGSDSYSGGTVVADGRCTWRTPAPWPTGRV